MSEYYPENRSAWRQWLARNHAKEKSIKVVLSKKANKGKGISYAEAVEEALCFGWIDSKPAKRDAKTYLMHFASRKKGSAWSKINKDRINRMIKSGNMTAAGMVKIQAAKKDGSWIKLNAIDALVMPLELKKGLATQKEAGKNFHAFPAGVKKRLYFWVSSARRQETLRMRVAEIVSRAARNERANQWVKKKG